jgi:hypothetical protein
LIIFEWDYFLVPLFAFAVSGASTTLICLKTLCSKFSTGVQSEIESGITLSGDYVHTLCLFEPRAPNINPQIQNICNTPYPGSTPFSPLCVRGVSRRLAQALVNAGFPANRLEQINMIGTMNRPLFDSWTTQLKYHRRNMLFMPAMFWQARAHGAVSQLHLIV